MSTSKRKSDDYSQVCGYIKKPLALRFRTVCKAKELEISTVMEELIEQWLEGQKVEI